MLESDDHWDSVGELFAAAAMGGDWEAALNAMADASGGRNGELIGLGPEGPLFSWTTRFDPAARAEWDAIGGYAPEINPRVSMGARAPVMRAWHEVQCTTDEEFQRAADHAEHCRRWDIPYGSQATVLRGAGLLVGMSVTRGAAAGVPQAEDRRAFEALMPTVRSAVLTQMALEHQGMRLVQGALEGLGLAAFICDWSGRVRALTPAAEAAIARGPLRLSQGRLGAARPDDAHQLSEAIDAASAGPVPVRTLLIRDASPLDVEVAEVIALPRQPFAFGFQPRVLVTLRGADRRDAGLPNILRAAFGLTRTEAEIAVTLADGEARSAIADARGISIQTLRMHIKRVFTKLGVQRETQLAARLQRMR